MSIEQIMRDRVLFGYYIEQYSGQCAERAYKAFRACNSAIELTHNVRSQRSLTKLFALNCCIP